jgi:hypothetical protein
MWHGGPVARETKPLLPSAWQVALEQSPQPSRAPEIVRRAIRSPDPWLTLTPEWVVRRLSPICGPIELGDLPGRRDELRLLRAMGWETANVHLGSDGARKAIAADLERRPGDWLRGAARRMRATVDEDFADWRNRAAEETAPERKFPAP